MAAEQTIKIWPDADPEVTTVDGQMYRYKSTDTWAGIRDGDGTAVNDWHGLLDVRIDCSSTANMYKRISRSIFLFDTSVIPPGSLIVSARVGIEVSDKYKTSAWTIAPAIYESFPLSNTSLAKADYNRFHNTILSNAIEYADIDEVFTNIFTLNPAGLLAITRGGITKLGFRDSKYDAPNIPPPWAYGVYCYVHPFSSDFGPPAHYEYLEVTFKPPPISLRKGNIVIDQLIYQHAERMR